VPEADIILAASFGRRPFALPELLKLTAPLNHPRLLSKRDEFAVGDPIARGQQLEFPASLSTASYDDFESWVGLVLRRAKRGVSDEDEAD
jgi:hypothetical protein